MSTVELILPRQRHLRAWVSLFSAMLIGAAGLTLLGLWVQAAMPMPLMGSERVFVNVNAEFARYGVDVQRRTDIAGEVPADSLAHIFRKNPTDREDLTGLTTADDFLLESPASLDQGCGHDANALAVSLRDLNVGAREVVYHIRGNLWIDNPTALSIWLDVPAGVQVRFVVTGDIFFADDLRLAAGGGQVSFHALQDPFSPTSGNIVLHDARYGTLSEIDADLYATSEIIRGRVSNDLVLRGRVQLPPPR